MSLTFHEAKKEYIDKLGNELVNGIMKRNPIKVTAEQVDAPDFLNRNVLALGEITEFMDLSKEDRHGKIIERFRQFKDEGIGFDHNGFALIDKIVQSILKDQQTKQDVIERFLINIIFNWCVASHRKETQQVSLADWITQAHSDHKKESYVYLPVLFLDIVANLDIGNVHFLYLKENYLRELAELVASDRRSKYLESMLAYKSVLFARVKVIAEEEKGVELARESITLAVDVLRILSPVVEAAELPIYFDVDYRNVHQQKSECLIQPLATPENFTQQIRVKPRPYLIDQATWRRMLQLGLVDIHAFLIRTSSDHTELESLILNGIRNFSKAIASHDFHERIVAVFTVLESLLLPDDGAPIIDSVSKYLPRLITKDFQERKNIVETLKAMYQVRSAMVHHAKRNKFDMPKLATLQICARNLLLQLIKLSSREKTKKGILQQLDDNILAS